MTSVASDCRYSGIVFSAAAHNIPCNAGSSSLKHDLLLVKLDIIQSMG